VCALVLAGLSGAVDVGAEPATVGDGVGEEGACGDLAPNLASIWRWICSAMLAGAAASPR